MTQQEVVVLKKEIAATSSYYQVKLDDVVLSMYVEDLVDLPIELALEGYRRYRKNPRNIRFPLPAQIRGIVKPEVSLEDKARDAAGRIVAAISKFGYSNFEQAKNFVGPLGWEVVMRQGGWETICQRTMQDELPIYQAQWTKYAQSIIHLIESGESTALTGVEFGSISQRGREILEISAPKGVE